ncbi:hypothetical protein AB3S75_045869 [Citrus x aurantiifolia]
MASIASPYPLPLPRPRSLSPFLPIPFIHVSPPSSSRHNSKCSPSFHITNNPRLSPSIIYKQGHRNRSVVMVRSQLSNPIISPNDHWGTWTALFVTGAFGLWSEKTKLGSMVSAALVSTLLGLAASNLGIIPYEAKAYAVFLEFLLPLSIPLLLFRADLRRIVQSTGILCWVNMLFKSICVYLIVINYFSD